MTPQMNDEINNGLFCKPYADASHGFPTRLVVTHHWRQKSGDRRQTMYTMHLDHQPMIQCSSDNGTVREIAGWYQDGREFVWLEAYDQFVQRQSSEREKGEDAEGNDPQPTTLPQPPPPTLPSDMAHVSSQTNGEGCHSQPKAKTVTYDWKATSTFEYDRNTSAGARSGASASVPLSPGLASVGSHGQP